MAIYFRLFHGRPSPDYKLDDWGSDGPVFGTFEWVHTVYINHFVFGSDGSDEGPNHAELTIVEDLIYYDGAYYGDMDVYTEHNIGDLLGQVVAYDPEKAVPKEKVKNKSHGQFWAEQLSKRKIKPPKSWNDLVLNKESPNKV